MPETKEVNLPTLTVGEKEMSVEEILAKLKTAEAGESLKSDYFTIEEGVENNIVFLGMTEIRGKGEKSNQMVPAVKLLDGADGKVKINADVVLVSTCQNLELQGKVSIALRVTAKGMVKGNSGEYKNLEIVNLKFKD